MIDSLPEVRVAVHVVKTFKNTLSNRFIPYPEIEVRVRTFLYYLGHMKTLRQTAFWRLMMILTISRPMNSNLDMKLGDQCLIELLVGLLEHITWSTTSGFTIQHGPMMLLLY